MVGLSENLALMVGLGFVGGGVGLNEGLLVGAREQYVGLGACVVLHADGMH